jgi:BMFP domain-containing protein YqiC
MSTGTNRMMDEFARLMTDAAGAAQGVRREVETAFQAQAERFLNNMDLVRRDEFDVVREMAIKARDENDALKARLEALEAKLAASNS